MKCSGVSDHRYFKDSYRIYTGVVTYYGYDDAESLAEAHSTRLTARSYMRYYDANGLYRTYYNNYTGTNTMGGCSASYTSVYESIGITN